jgi:hypothetical protein
MTAMGLRPGKLPFKANDSNGLEAKEIAGQGQSQQWAGGQRNSWLRPMTAMGWRPKKLPVEANDSNGLEIDEIDNWSQQWQ